MVNRIPNGGVLTELRVQVIEKPNKVLSWKKNKALEEIKRLNTKVPNCVVTIEIDRTQKN
jgi:hypothetical protein